MREMAWGLKLTGVSPVAKLVAIYVGDHTWVGGEGAGTPISIVNLQEFACSNEAAVRAALVELGRVGIGAAEVAPGRFYFTLPLEPERPSLPRGPDVSPLQIYVMSCGDRTKVGISGNSHARRTEIQKLIASEVVLEWHHVGPAHLIRRVERDVLALLQHARVHSEWFLVTAAEAIIVVKHKLADAGLA